MVLIVGHRGARDLWAENSLSGFKKTLALGVDSVEFDVHLARDGVPVVIHDPTLDRTTEGSGPVCDHTSAELARVPLKGAADEGVPTLDAVLDIFAGAPLELHIEIKTDVRGNAYPGLEALVLEAVRRRGLETRVVLTCFVPSVLEMVRRLAPDSRLLASLDRRSAEMLGGLQAALQRFSALDCVVAVEQSLLRAGWDQCLAALGSERLGAWVPNTEADLRHWLARPIRQITTDRPDLAIKLRDTAVVVTSG